MNTTRFIWKAAFAALVFATAIPAAIALPPRVVVVPGRPVYASRVADVQRVLMRRGLYAGPADGIDGPRTSAAIRVYQARHGLAVTGNINPALLRSMGL